MYKTLSEILEDKILQVSTEERIHEAIRRFTYGPTVWPRVLIDVKLKETRDEHASK